jgi:hypothetical protein
MVCRPILRSNRVSGRGLRVRLAGFTLLPPIINAFKYLHSCANSHCNAVFLLFNSSCNYSLIIGYLDCNFVGYFFTKIVSHHYHVRFLASIIEKNRFRSFLCIYCRLHDLSFVSDELPFQCLVFRKPIVNKRSIHSSFYYSSHKGYQVLISYDLFFLPLNHWLVFQINFF